MYQNLIHITIGSMNPTFPTSVLSLVSARLFRSFSHAVHLYKRDLRQLLFSPTSAQIHTPPLEIRRRFPLKQLRHSESGFLLMHHTRSLLFSIYFHLFFVNGSAIPHVGSQDHRDSPAYGQSANLYHNTHAQLTGKQTDHVLTVFRAV